MQSWKGESCQPQPKSKSVWEVGRQSVAQRPSTTGVLLCVRSTSSTWAIPWSHRIQPKTDPHLERGGVHLSFPEICWEEPRLQLSIKLRGLTLSSLSKGQSRSKCFPKASQFIITSTTSLRSWGTREVSAYDPWMSPAFPKHLARNRHKRVLCIGHLTYFILTLLAQQCSGYSPHTRPFLALDNCQGCCQQAQF